ncbi:MAG: OmpH family outer membrane protein [Bacteroidales bacterium]|nr:OmpH family outer membrane protein [Bacteroidales bacterium]
MKKFFFALFSLTLLTAGIALNAQNLKFGHIESQRIVIQMPEYTNAGDSLNVVKGQYDLQLERMQVEINRKYNELVENQNSLDSLILESMFAEYQSMGERLQNFQGQVQTKLRNLEASLLEEVMAKLENAIKAVAEEMDLIYVFDISARNPIYASEKSLDIGPMVKEKLGVE